MAEAPTFENPEFESAEWHRRRLRPAAKILFYSGAARIHTDGGGIGIVLRWWHPLAWLVFLLTVIVVFLMHGASGVISVARDEVGFWVTSRYYREHPDRLVWLRFRNNSYTREV